MDKALESMETMSDETRKLEKAAMQEAVSKVVSNVVQVLKAEGMLQGVSGPVGGDTMLRTMATHPMERTFAKMREKCKLTPEEVKKEMALLDKEHEQSLALADREYAEGLAGLQKACPHKFVERFNHYIMDSEVVCEYCGAIGAETTKETKNEDK